jgi:CheY-like chemotaxis protein
MHGQDCTGIGQYSQRNGRPRPGWLGFCPPLGSVFARRQPIVSRILIVEDSADNMKLFRALLTLKGHQVTGLPGGEGLLETIGAFTPELVLMDIQLPGKDGFALLEEIRGSSHCSLRVIALTAHAMAGDQERALQAGFDGYITKPIEIRGFPELVQRALDGANT